jgi:Radical SAM superfamily
LQKTVFAITPPFTQLNTPYPATAYIKGFLNTKNISTFQADLGIEVILAMFSKKGLQDIFEEIASKKNTIPFSQNSLRIIALKKYYIDTIDTVVAFLQGKNPTLALQIEQENFLPEAARFSQLEEDLTWAFGSMGTQDKAKHLATLYLEDLSDLITECVDPYFGFSRYAERLGRSANSFDELYNTLNQELTYTDRVLFPILQIYLTELHPELLVISVPFPGNLYSAFRIGQYTKQHFPNTRIAFGGGFANTELRSISDVRVFEFFDYISLDDGEAPLEAIIASLKAPNTALKRTFVLENEHVVYKNNRQIKDYKQSEVGTPDYSDLKLSEYISVLEVINPMHRMWSDGRWNKLTMAHGCYWGKCTFCDISLDYIKLYEPIAANILCDRIEELVAQTGQTGFHFVDEAAPPALMRALAHEILKRNLKITWWTNIRFEKSFGRDLCRLLQASGCVAVSGGLEVASDRLLELIKKGVTVSQVAQVTRNFTEAGIMVHAYLMYGFPTQTTQETIDSLEMVRQLFEMGVIQSGFWHQFAMTAHSPVGMFPAEFKVIKETESIGTFANNDILFEDTIGTDHEAYSFGLKKSLHNYMHGICFEMPLQDWFDFKIPETSILPDYIENAITEPEFFSLKSENKLLFINDLPNISHTQSKKGEIVILDFYTKKDSFQLKLPAAEGRFVVKILEQISVNNSKLKSYGDILKLAEKEKIENFELLWTNKIIPKLKNQGLLTL